MRKYPTDEEVIQRARVNREKAMSTAGKSSNLVSNAARLEETIRQTEQHVEKLKAIVANRKRRSSNPRQETKS